jgi:hypothetical protein
VSTPNEPESWEDFDELPADELPQLADALAVAVAEHAQQLAVLAAQSVRLLAMTHQLARRLASPPDEPTTP